MKFKKGDRIKLNETGTIHIWVQPDKIYKVLGHEIQPPEPGTPCYRNCGHPMHDPKPEMVFVKVQGKFGICTIYEGCFDKI